MTVQLKLILSVLAVLAYTSAIGGGKDPLKTNGCKHNYPTKMEDLIFMFPGNSQRGCTENTDNVNKSVLEFYRWYLKNEPRFNAYTNQQKNNLDFMPPFNISWQEMQEYVNFIRKAYPDVDTVHVTPNGAPLKITAAAQDTNISFGEDIYH